MPRESDLAGLDFGAYGAPTPERAVSEEHEPDDGWNYPDKAADFAPLLFIAALLSCAFGLLYWFLKD